MPRDYQTWPLDRLLIALEQSGRHPPLSLIRTLLSDPPGLRTILLMWLATAADESWYPDDDLWFRTIHAGLLLIALQETAALPIFARLYRKPALNDLTEWFEMDIASYGPAAVEWAFDFLYDRSASDYARWTASEILFEIGTLFPDTRPRVLEGLRAYLPSLKSDGTPELADAEMADPDEMYAWVAMALAHLRDAESRAQIEALYRHNLIDPGVMGDVDEYLHILLYETEIPSTPHPYDLVERYRAQYERDRRMDLLSRAERAPTEGEILALLGSAELALRYLILMNQ